MAPPKWTTKEQEEWLQPWYEKYSGKQGKKCRNFNNFFADLNEQWFDVFTEPCPNNCTTVGPLTKEEWDEAIDARKNKLYTRFKNTFGGSRAGRQAKAKATDAFDAVNMRLTLNSTMPTASNKQQPLTNGRHVALLKKETATLYAGESEEVKSKVKEYIVAQKNQRMQNQPETWSVEDQKRNLTKLAAVANQFLEGLADTTGLAFSLLVGGPSAELGGLIDVWSFHVGQTTLGNDFSQAYPDFESRIVAPFRDYLYRVYLDAAVLKKGEMGTSKSPIAHYFDTDLAKFSSSLNDTQFHFDVTEHAELDWMSDDYLNRLQQMSMGILPGASAADLADPLIHAPIVPPTPPTPAPSSPSFLFPMVSLPAVLPPIVLPPIVSSPIKSSPIVSSPIVSPPIVSPPIVSSPIKSSPIVSSPIVSPPIVSSPIMLPPIMSSPIVSPPIMLLSETSGSVVLSPVLPTMVSLPAVLPSIVSPSVIDNHCLDPGLCHAM
ncbi:hypothetical protein C8R48DRAFT_766554 [Suillus tomentosus]|nr:hypothetical protein C8R48DRAFT_766554 [Suillus tomentosus]